MSVETFGALRNTENGGKLPFNTKALLFQILPLSIFFRRPGFSDKKATSVPGMNTDEVKGIALN